MTLAFSESILSLDQHLIQLVYRSRSLIEGVEYDQLLETCLRNNPKREITGVLVSHSGWFLQVLEGTAVNVFSLFKTIEDDPRHSDFLMLRFKFSLIFSNILNFFTMNKISRKRFSF